MKKTPTVWEAYVLKTNALDIKVSDQIASLEEAIGSLDKGERFFAKTHITRGLKDLMNEGIARLGGSSSQAVFHLKQAMGGGKTHLLTCMGLLARHPELRQKSAPIFMNDFLLNRPLSPHSMDEILTAFFGKKLPSS